MCHKKNLASNQADGVPRGTLQCPEAAQPGGIRSLLPIGRLLSLAGRRCAAMSAAASAAARDIEHHEGC
jgi:hypothetical protein